MARWELERFGRCHANILHLAVFNLLFLTLPAQAQLTPDNTLGSEASRVTPNVLINGGNATRIDGGAVREINLFHSFREFNINENQRVYFANPSGVQNILTRVTGANPSNIFGTLGVDGAANLFLINPNGILFGQNASLDIRGSFVGTTANSVQFGNQGFFSATNPEAVPLLTVNPNALFYNQINPNANITNRSQAPAGVNPDGNNTTGLRVPDGKSLLLIGGNIISDGGRLRAFDGRVELTGLATSGSVGLNRNGDIWSLAIPQNASLADVFLGNISAIGVFGNKGGDIAINARNIDINNSYIFAGIAATGSPTSQGGDVTLNATGSILLSGDSGIDNSVYGRGNSGNTFIRANDAVKLDSGDIFNTIAPGGVGDSGDINIQAGSLTLTDSAQLLTSARKEANNLPGGRGNAGDVNINVRDGVVFANPRSQFLNGVSSDIGKGAVGNGGNVTINAGSLAIRDGSEIQNSVWGKGNAGNITINTRDKVELDGRNGNNYFSRIIAPVQAGAEGQAGNISITTGNLQVRNGAFLVSNTLGKGNAGDITINTGDIRFDNYGYASNLVSSDAIGNAGEIRINTNTLTLLNGSTISSDVLGRGNGGNITITARDSIQFDGVMLDAGKFLGVNSDFDTASGISSSILGSGTGNAGNIVITAPVLSLTNGGQVWSSSNERGNAGNVTINARDRVIIDGFGSGNTFRSEILSAVSNSSGDNPLVSNGGDIRINTGDLIIKNGGAIESFNFSIGNAGNIFLDIGNTMSMDGSAGDSLPSNVSSFVANGDAGDINIKTGSLSITNGANINSSLLGIKGTAGNITINARDNLTIDGISQDLVSSDGKIRNSFSSIASSLLQGEGRGGDIDITAGSLNVTNGANISASTGGKGDGGNITINVRDTVTLDTGSNRIYTTIGNSASSNSTGNGGDIRLNARELILKNGANLSSFSSGSGNAGNIFIDTRDAVTFDGSDERNVPSMAATFATGSGNGGKVEVNTGTLRLTNGGQIFAIAKRNAGNIDITARDGVIIDGRSGTDNLSSGINSTLSEGGVGKGGDIRITTSSFTLRNGGTISASIFGQGKGGDITINATGKFFLEGIQADGLVFDTGIFSTVYATGQGQGGNINVTTGDISLNRAAISAGSTGEGTGGDINIQAGRVRLDNNSAIASITNSGNGGNINLTADKYLLLRGNSFISTTAGLQSSGGDGGNIKINTPAIVAIPNQDNNITANAFTGKGGNVNITTQALFGIAPASSDLPTSNDITASSQQGVQGEVSVTEPDVDPTQGIIELPVQVEDKSDQIGRACPRNYAEAKRQGSFTITGRGSLAPSSLEFLSGEINQTQLATLPSDKIGNIPESRDNSQATKSISTLTPIVEAQGWVKMADGQVQLVAKVPNQILPSSLNHSACVPHLQK